MKADQFIKILHEFWMVDVDMDETKVVFEALMSRHHVKPIALSEMDLEEQRTCIDHYDGEPIKMFIENINHEGCEKFLVFNQECIRFLDFEQMHVKFPELPDLSGAFQSFKNLPVCS